MQIQFSMSALCSYDLYICILANPAREQLSHHPAKQAKPCSLNAEPSDGYVRQRTACPD